jgi:non-heme chloroperoxidase
LKNQFLTFVAVLMLASIIKVDAQTSSVPDASPHKTQFATVGKGVKLEVLDWGGYGPPMIFLAGLGDTAHEFDTFAPKFTARHHVYGITRRGFGLSSSPPPTDDNYDADRLGDDVIAVIDSLKLNRPPILVGSSMGGEELSSVGTRYPQKVTALIYLNATYPESYYDPTKVWDPWVDSALVRRRLAELTNATPSRSRVLIAEIQSLLPHLKKSLQIGLEENRGLPDWRIPPGTQQSKVQWAMIHSERAYSRIKPLALVIASLPEKCTKNCGTPGVKAREAAWAAQIKSVESGWPTAQVVRIPNSEHWVFQSNETDVIREMNAFMDGLPH